MNSGNPVNPAEHVEEQAAELARSAYLIGVFHAALKDQRLPDALVDAIVRDWHYATLNEEWDQEADD